MEAFKMNRFYERIVRRIHFAAKNFHEAADTSVGPERIKQRRMLIYSKGQRFIDWKKIVLKAGNGGSGCASFVHSRDHKGGPNGGDGGHGGSIFMQADQNFQQLSHLKHHYVAESGNNGKPKNMHGRSGKDLILKVPVGTCIKHKDTDKIVADLVIHGQLERIVSGGKKGIGNVHYRSAVNVKPEEFTKGEHGEESQVEVELKAIADVGLVGFPNAGKSTLLRQISKAKPKVASYPFTTLKPNLGIIKYSDNTAISVADIPGLVENAHKNKGLGHVFLRHIERCKCLLYVIDITSPNHPQEFAILQNELQMYKKDLTSLASALIVNKIDLFEDKHYRTFQDIQIPVIEISALLGKNVTEVKNTIYELVKATEAVG